MSQQPKQVWRDGVLGHHQLCGSLHVAVIGPRVCLSQLWERSDWVRKKGPAETYLLQMHPTFSKIWN